MAVPVAVHQPSPDRTLAVWLDSTPDLSSTNSTQAHWMDIEHQPTDLVVLEGRGAASHLTGQLVGRILLHTMAESLSLLVEAVGCPTVCRHCWAQGTPYQAMPLGDVSRVLEEAHRFCADHGLGFGAYPMHELAAHPQAAELLRLFAGHVGAAEFEPLATTGVPLVTRKDWRELLAAAAELGTTTVWVAFHGIGTEHDRQVNRPGAWAETCLAVQRVHAAGLRAGCNVFVTTTNAGQAGRLLGALERLDVDEMSWEPATYYPTARGRRNERLRAALSDLLPIADQVRQCGPFHREAWANLAGHTEAAWTDRALAGDWPTWKRHDGQVLELVCRANLDLHFGTAGRYGERLGNLGTDGADIVFGRALTHGAGSADASWFGPGPLPELAELAARHGNCTGQGVHFSADSVRYLWLDRARHLNRPSSEDRADRSGTVIPLVIPPGMSPHNRAVSPGRPIRPDQRERYAPIRHGRSWVDF